MNYSLWWITQIYKLTISYLSSCMEPITWIFCVILNTPKYNACDTCVNAQTTTNINKGRNENTNYNKYIYSWKLILFHHFMLSRALSWHKNDMSISSRLLMITLRWYIFLMHRKFNAMGKFVEFNVEKKTN